MHFSTGQISKLLSRENSAGIYTEEDSQEYFPFRIHIFHRPPFAASSPGIGAGGGEERERRRLGLSFSSRLLSSRLFKKGGKKERKEGGGKKKYIRREENHDARDMIVVRQRALNQVGFMRRHKEREKERKRGRTLAQTRSFEGRLLRRGGKCRARP